MTSTAQPSDRNNFERSTITYSTTVDLLPDGTLRRGVNLPEEVSEALKREEKMCGISGEGPATFLRDSFHISKSLLSRYDKHWRSNHPHQVPDLNAERDVWWDVVNEASTQLLNPCSKVQVAKDSRATGWRRYLTSATNTFRNLSHSARSFLGDTIAPATEVSGDKWAKQDFVTLFEGMDEDDIF